MKFRFLFTVLAIMAGNVASAAVPIPSAIAVPSDHKLILTVTAKGVQIYGCTVGSDDHPAWTLTAPEATLFDEAGKTIGKHFGGPSWQLDDGSLVTGAPVARDPGPVATAIPWLLVKVASNNGKGVLAAAQMIQRLQTEGGLAPSTACTKGQEVRVPYSASYLFYAKS
jgi:hypothetical protein